MTNDANDKRQELLRKYVVAALYDFLTYATSIRDPIIIGGQYPRDKMLRVFNKWCLDRKVNVKEITADDSKLWFNSCQRGGMAGSMDMTTPPDVEETLPDIKKTFPKTKKTPIKKLPLDIESTNDTEEKGYFEGDEWKPQEDKPKRWTDSGEDWKKGEGDENPAPI